MKSLKNYLLLFVFLSSSFGLVVAQQGQDLNTSPKTPPVREYASQEMILVKTKVPYTQVVSTFETKQQRQQALRADLWSSILLKADAQYCKKAFPYIKGDLIDNILEIRVGKPTYTDQTIEELKKLPFVQYAEKQPIFYTETLPMPNDTRLNEQYAMRLTRALQATVAYNGTGNTWVAIIDDGVLITHEDLVGNLWTNPIEIAGNNIDDDNNGYIDDINGWDAADGDNNPNPPLAIAGPNQFSHGTHCAGVAGAVTNNNKGISAISHNQLKIIAVKATRDNISPPYNVITNSLQGIQYVVALKQRYPTQNIVASMSFGSANPSQAVQDLINTGASMGILFVAAAGNAGNETILYPCGYSNVICVANTNENDIRNPSSQFGSWVDISAPGTNILSTVAHNFANPLGVYTTYTGTSMSTPMVAGLAALVWSQKPSATAAEIEDILKSTADDIYSVNSGLVGKLGAGRINALGAILSARNQHNIVPSVISDLAIVPNSLNATQVSLTWTAPSVNGTFPAVGYELRFSTNPITQSNFTNATLVNPNPIPSINGQTEVYELRGLTPQTTYYVAIRSRNVTGGFSNISNVVQFTTLPTPNIQLAPTTISTTLNLDNGNTASTNLTVTNTGVSGSLLNYQASLFPSPVRIRARMFYDKDIDNTSDNGLGLGGNGGFLSAARFQTGANSFLLTHVQNYIRNNANVAVNIRISIVRGNSASLVEGGVLLTTQVTTLNTVSGGAMFTIPLNNPQTIPANTTFWVIFDLPSSLGNFPQGFDNVGATPNATFISQDGGNTFTDLQTVSTSFANAVFKIRAISGVTGWVTLAGVTTANNIPSSQTATMTLNFDATDLLPGTYTAQLVVNNNSTSQPSLSRTITLNVIGGKPIIHIAEVNPIANGVVCEGADINIPISNLGKGTLSITAVNFQNLVGISSSNLSVTTPLPFNIPAESQGSLGVKVNSSTPINSLSGVVRILHNDTQTTPKDVPFTGKIEALRISQIGNFLVANANMGLQWFIAEDAIPNARSGSYTPTFTGDYKVKMTIGNCTATSNTIRFVVSGIENGQKENAITIFPNPVNNVLNLNYRSPKNSTTIQVFLYNSQGKIIANSTLENIQGIFEYQFDLSKQMRGLYLLQIVDKDQSIVQKFIK
ncbi:MAG: S8 family serine peptidase [Microscillaceae bacterium]|nr:S8 family serine peptidase [Microscillaceae bacterium]MDW8461711.1 S8 family serine peptidase [Cytophagales bacterium]